ncbi:MAG: serine/threonine protein kinase [Candidatus Aureabacteria bacterium]|nr:serine/threonine protein kinase [Candidatus Auribacterota bacterium]
MKDDILKQIEQRSLNLKSDTVEKNLSDIVEKFNIDLSSMKSSDITIAASTKKQPASATAPKKRDIKYSGSNEDADYRVLDLLEKGSLCNTYIAEQISLKRKVTIKMLRNDIKQKDNVFYQFMSEARITGELSHPNIIPVHDAGTDPEGRPFYIMKNLQGILWNSLLHPETPEEKKEAEKYGISEHLEILESVCNAIAFAHSKDVIHRDIKPLNVVIGEFGEVIVMNWGLTVSVGDDTKSSNSFEINSFGGTFNYMAPEMAKAETVNIGKKSDIYLLGAILYEILTGYSPHEADTAKESLTNAMQNKIKPPSKDLIINKELMVIALKAMETDTNRRFSSVIDLQKHLRSYMDHDESRALTEEAKQYLESSQKQNEQIKSFNAVVLLEEALELWKENLEAKELLEQSEKMNRKFSNEFSSCLVKLIIRGDIYKILLRLITIPAYFMLFLLPFFFYLYIIWATPLYEVGVIKISEFDKWEANKSIIISEHYLKNTYLLFDGEDIYNIELGDSKLKMSALSVSKLVDSEENEYYLEQRKWIVKKVAYQIYIDEQSEEVVASEGRYMRVINPITLLKVKKQLYDMK